MHLCIYSHTHIYIYIFTHTNTPTACLYQRTIPALVIDTQVYTRSGMSGMWGCLSNLFSNTLEWQRFFSLLLLSCYYCVCDLSFFYLFCFFCYWWTKIYDADLFFFVYLFIYVIFFLLLFLFFHSLSLGWSWSPSLSHFCYYFFFLISSYLVFFS